MWVKSSISNSNSKLLCGSKSYPCQVLSWKVKLWMSQQTGSWQTLQQMADPHGLLFTPPAQITSCKFISWTSHCCLLRQERYKAGASQTEMDEPLSLRVFVDE